MSTAVNEIKTLSSLFNRQVDVPPSPPSRWPNQPDPLAKEPIMTSKRLVRSVPKAEVSDEE